MTSNYLTFNNLRVFSTDTLSEFKIFLDKILKSSDKKVVATTKENLKILSEYSNSLLEEENTYSVYYTSTMNYCRALVEKLVNYLNGLKKTELKISTNKEDFLHFAKNDYKNDYKNEKYYPYSTSSKKVLLKDSIICQYYEFSTSYKEKYNSEIHKLAKDYFIINSKYEDGEYLIYYTADVKEGKMIKESLGY